MTPNAEQSLGKILTKFASGELAGLKEDMRKHLVWLAWYFRVKTWCLTLEKYNANFTFDRDDDEPLWC